MMPLQMRTDSVLPGRTVSERRSGKKTGIRAALLSSVAAFVFQPTWADPLPTGANVVSGNVSIATPSAQRMNITQGGSSAIVNWNSFSIGHNAHVDIRQPGVSSTMLNRVTGETTSEIHGRLTANGQVYLVNPNGIYIGPNGTVDTGAFVASTLDISDDDFLAGRLRFNGNGRSARVENAGRIGVGPGGYAALLGGRVKNSGVVTVPLGRVGFASGEQVTLDLSGDQFLQVALPIGGDDNGEALIENSGLVSAEGGLIEMRAATARQAVRHAINLSGVAEARSVSMRNGAIVLGGGAGGRVTVSGTVSTREAPATTSVTTSLRPQERPEITITGQAVELAGAEIDASHSDGGGLIRIGGDFAGEGDLLRADTMTIDADSTIRADALVAGQGGRIAIWSELHTDFTGTVSARGGAESGDGGFIEISGREKLSFAGSSDTRAENGEWGTLLLDPTDVFISPGAGANNEDEIEAALATNNLVIDTSAAGTDSGNIFVDAFLDWTAATTLTLNADNDIDIFNGIDADNGNLTMIAGNNIILDADGSISVDELSVNATGFFAQGNVLERATGGGINVTVLSFSGDSWQQLNPVLSPITATRFSATGSSFLRALGGDGTVGNPYQIADIYGLQGIGTPSLIGSNFVLANNIDASGTANWTPISGSGFQPISFFTGTLDGAGFAVSNLTISSFFDNDGTLERLDAAMFDGIGSTGVVTNLTLINADVVGGNGGVLANINDGTISNVRVSGTLDTEGFDTGGLVGLNFGTIVDSIADVDVTVNIVDEDIQHLVGGFVGWNAGAIARAHSLGTVDVTNTELFNSFLVGGFAGLGGDGEGSAIEDSYALGDVSIDSTAGAGINVSIGGFVGDTAGFIERNFAAGLVSATGDATVLEGGFAGEDNSGGDAIGNLWDTVSSGQATSATGTGLTTAEFQDTETFLSIGAGEGWDFATVWAPGDTGFYPVNYTTSPVVLADPDPVTVASNGLATATTTGTVTGGPDLYVFDDPANSLNEASIFFPLIFSGTTEGPQTFRLGAASVASATGPNFRVIDRPGNATITAPEPGSIGPGDEIPRPPTVIEVGLPNPPDQITGDDGDGGSATIQEDRDTLSVVESVAGELIIGADACSESGGDVNRYLACLSDALNDFAGELDAIASDLPPSMRNVAQIIQTARVDIDRARARAQQRLSNATSDAEREEIRRDALNEARSALSTASGEIRKSIALVRVQDPELASIHRATITTVADAVDTVGIQLTRAVGL